MNKTIHHHKAGFTLVEVVVASAVASLVVAGTFAAFIHASRFTQAGGSQVQFNATARIVQQKLVAYVQEGKTVGVVPDGSGIDIISVATNTYTLKSARIYLLDMDNKPNTVSNNYLIYDIDTTIPAVPSTGLPQNKEILARHIGTIGTNRMFSIVASSPSSAHFCFTIGDGTNVSDASFSGTGQGYQGIEVRVSATPRNLQRWY